MDGRREGSGYTRAPSHEAVAGHISCFRRPRGRDGDRERGLGVYTAEAQLRGVTKYVRN